MKKILVTGGMGYIGSHTVVELHNNGYEPIIVDNLAKSEPWVKGNIEKLIGKEVTFYQEDCNDISALNKIFEKEGNIEGVIHFAAFKSVGESVEQPAKYFENNFNSTLKVMEAMKKHNTKYFIFSSSCSVYGNPDKLPVTEETPMKKAESPYAFTKQVCERMIEDVHVAGVKFSSIILRYFNPIGAHPSTLIGELPLDRPSNLVPVITRATMGKIGPMHVHGNDYDTTDGTCVRDYIHVVDLADAHVKALQYLEDVNKENFVDIFNVGTGKGNSVLDMITTFEKENDEKVPYSIGPRRAGDVVEVYADCTKVNKVMKWDAKLTAANALKDAWKWELYLKEREGK